MTSIPGFNMLLLGESGSGKTHSVRTLIANGIETFVVFTEPGMTTIADVSCDKGLHWHYIPAAAPSFDDMIESARKINTALDLEALTKIKTWNKSKYQQFIEVLTTLNGPKCDRCERQFASVDTWTAGQAIVIDSLSGLSVMAMDLAVGSKPVKSPADWGTAMDNLERFINRMCMNTKCHFVMTAHLEREKNEVSGGVTLMASTLGQKLAPKIPRYFDDIVHCVREGADFHWSNTTTGVSSLKSRNIPFGAKHPPSFSLALQTWKARGGVPA